MIKVVKNIGSYFLLLRQVFIKPENKKVYYNRIISEIIALGVNSLSLVAIISLFMGAVVAIQTGLQLGTPFIPKYLIGFATRESLILEFSPTMISLILAGKVGSSIASEVGSMRISEQIDALEIMGVNSRSFIIQPKIIACVIFFPILVIISMAVGMFGGYLAVLFSGIVSPAEYFRGLNMWFNPFYITYAIVKTLFFAFIISSISAYFGYFTSGGALEVGKSSTNAVVYCCIVILLVNFIITQLMIA